MEWNKKFNYPSSTRALIQGKRHYSLDGSNLPSVTTILSATKSEEDKAALAAWKERVGKLEADRIKKEASSRGSSIHKFIEEFLHGKLNQDLIDDKNHSPGHYKVKWNASESPGGIYFCRMKAGKFIETYKMILLK